MLDGVHFYNQTLKKTVAVFGTIFNNLKIRKTGQGEVRVPIAYGPRQKFLARIEQDSSLEDQKLAIKLPRISFEITGIDYDPTSKLNKFNIQKYNIAGSTTNKDQLRQGVPYNISMQLNILAKTQDDALQIFEQILPTFTPEYVVAIKDMEGPGRSADVPITLQGTSIQDEYEGDFTSRRTLIYQMDFTMKVRFHGRVDPKPIIKVVDVDLFNDTTITSSQLPVDQVRTDLNSPAATEENHTAVTTFGFDLNSPGDPL